MAERNTSIDDVNDIVDFFLAWHTHRETVLQISRMDQLNDVQKRTLFWLVQMADRVSLADLEKDGRV
ncbi:hypothetical protein [Roseibium salinum]|uniref:MarR family transcriptional regulator n=1 Tax=Roseibium salinum TaxID=1604349 RepID=A0ABT3QWL6_9HYPH|nr:hypothetical protein [Roseibium sp. DSM 29163]MCX2721317.1 hypothetical protein [Roseibium sp. DSM 29163]